MSVLNMTKEEKEEILAKHKAATKEVMDRKASEKSGLKAPEKPVEKPKDKKK